MMESTSPDVSHLLDQPPLIEGYAEKSYKGHVCVNLKSSTPRGARFILVKCLFPEFGSMPIDGITRDSIETVAYRMLEADRVKEKKFADGSKTYTLTRSSVMGMGRTPKGSLCCLINPLPNIYAVT